MNKRLLSLTALALGLAASSATAQTTPPVLILNITDIQVTNDTVGQVVITNGGSGYAGQPPAVEFSGGGPAPGTAGVATGTANLSSGPGGPGTGNSVISVTLTANGTVPPGGYGYIGPPTVTFSGGGGTGSGSLPVSEATGMAYLYVTQDFPQPNQNEAYGPAGDTIGMLALASGTQPDSGFIYAFTVDGVPIGETQNATTPGEAAGIYWTPPLPGVYEIVSTTSDNNGNTATSAPIRYFAEGTVIVSPEAGGVPTPLPGPTTTPSPGSLVTVGSAVVIQATSTSADGFISRIDFYTDWTGSTATSTLIGSAKNYPYFVNYTPAGAAGTTHLIKAIGYDNSGTAVPPTVVATNPNQDEILLTMTTPSPNGGLPSALIVSPSSGSLVEIPNYIADATSSIPVITTAGALGGAGITQVQLYINGVLYATDSVPPYNFTWTPKTTGAFALLTLATDTNGNVVSSSAIQPGSSTPVPGPDEVIIEAAPAIAITAPGGGAIISAGATTAVQAVAIDTNLDVNGNPIPITLVQFYQDGNFVGSATSPTSGDLYQVSFKPTQKTDNGIVVPSQLTAIATDADGFQGTSPSVQVTVNSGGASTNPVVIGTPPTISISAPANNTNVIVNTPVTFSASGTAPNGNIASVAFSVDGAVVATLVKYPYQYTYTFANLGTYTVTATVTDNVGDTYTTPTPTTLIVVTEPPPTISITSPTSGSTVTTGNSVTLTANASSLSGTIASVEFFENGISIGTATMPPYTESFTPLSAGLYTFTAIATDGAGETTTSAPNIVEAFPASGGLGTNSYFGQYQGLTEGGRFAFIVVDGTLGTYIAYSTSGSPSTSFVTDIPVSSAGSFAGTSLAGTVSLTGVSGNLVPSQDLFIGAATQAGTVAVAGGYYTGNIQGQAGSQITAILGNDGELMAYISSGSFTDVAYGTVDNTGAFTITTAGGNTFLGTINPSTGFLTGTISGPSHGPVYGARVSGGTFSDGVLKNISTRGQVLSGSDVMIAGFVVGGTANKQLLIRAIGPTLTTFSLPGAISATQLQVYSGATLISSNTGWSSTPGNALAVSNADAQVGAFALPAGSLDSALVGSFPPGNYTAMVSGVSGATGIGLVEVYDMDAYTPFTTMKLTNVSTRGDVGTGNGVLIGGFEINGTAPKRLLIRGAGPGLSALNVSGALATPHLQLFNSSGGTIRENFAWQNGNDPGLVSEAEASTGAFAFGNGSADSAILIVLPPGTYTAEVSGVNESTGTALVEVYEVP
jgi:hypothetical protein